MKQLSEMLRPFLPSFRLVVLVGLVACSNYNSNSTDRDQYGPITLDAGDPRFQAAYTVLSMKCINCHQHSSWAAYTSDQAWISARKIIKNDAADSPIILQIQSGSMPQSGSISAAETQILIDWINQMP